MNSYLIAIYLLLIALCIILIFTLFLCKKQEKNKREIRFLNCALDNISNTVLTDTKGKRRLSIFYKDKFLTDRINGLTYKEIGEKYGFNDSTVRKALKRWGCVK